MLLKTSQPKMRFAVALLALAVFVGACTQQTQESSTAESAGGESATASDQFPYTFTNCDVEVTLEQEPQRIVLMEASYVPILAEFGLLDRVIARVGDFAEEYFTDDVNAQLAEIPALASESSTTGGERIALETIIEAEPDLVMGYEWEAITRDGLATADINLYSDPGYCQGEKPLAAYDNIYQSVELFGEMFDRKEEAETFLAELKGRVGEVESAAALPEGATAATIFVASDGSKIYAYGPRSMSHPQMESLGAANLYEDLEERVVEINVETIIDLDPDVLIVLHYEGDKTDEEVIELVKMTPGADQIGAVINNKVYPHLFNFSEPATPLVIDGLEILNEKMSRDH